MVLHGLDGTGKEIVEPLHSKFAILALRCVGVNFPAADKSPGVPDFTAEVAALLYLGLIVKYVIACRGAEQHTQTHGVGSVLRYQVKRIGAVAKRLAHLAAELVPDYAGEIYVAERNVLHEFVARHDHSCHPEENDVRCSHEIVGRIVICKVCVRSTLRMSGILRVEHGHRPKPAGEPGI